MLATQSSGTGRGALLFRAIVAFLVASLLLGVARTASAHAHVFILDTVEVVFSGRQVIALKLRWTFDELFSDGIFKDFDANGDRSFDATEAGAIRDMSLGSMKEFGYFTHVWVNGRLQQSFADAALEIASEGNIVIYEWLITLAEPIDPSRAKLEISVFDDSYYVDVVLRMPNPVTVSGAPAGCSYDVAEDETKAYYFDSIYPEVIRITCPGQ